MRFEDRAVEGAYREHHVESTKVLYRSAAVVALVGWSMVGLIDREIGGTEANARVMAWWRFVVVSPGVAAVLAWSFAPARWFRRTAEVALGAGVAVMLGGIAAITALAPDPAAHRVDQSVGGFILILMGGSTITGLRFAPFAVAALPMAAAMLATMHVKYPTHAVSADVWIGVGLATALAAAWLLESLRRKAWLAARELERERERSEALLRHVLPEAIAERLKREPGRRIADRHASVTVLFADIVGFTPLAGRVPPEQLVDALDELFSAFDALAAARGLEKIKTIGDSYMAVGGVPVARADHATAVADLALAMRDAVATRRALAGEKLQLRIGIHSGPVVAGVIGTEKLVYDLWGDTVNLAARMESHGVEDGIQVSEATRALLGDAFVCEPRGQVSVKGKGEVETWLLVGRS